MKKLEVLLRPFKLDEVKDALNKIGIDKITLTDVRASLETNKSKESSYLADDYVIEFMPRIKLEIVTTEKQIEKIASTIKKTLKNAGGDEVEILVLPIEKIL